MKDNLDIVTIDLSTYDYLKDCEFKFNNLIQELELIIEDATLNYLKDDLSFDKEFRYILKKYCNSQYLMKLDILKKELDNE